MTSDKRRTRTPRYTQRPKYRAAVLAHEAAVAELKAANTGGDARAIAEAERKCIAAASALAAANTERFQFVAEMRATTVMRGLDELMKLATQRRYQITETHADAIMRVIEGAVNDLRVTLRAAVTRPAGEARKRRIIFEAGEAQMDIEDIGKAA